jgi:hypothetical protein
MPDTHTALGPLELADGHWGIGDSHRPGAAWIEFREDGLYRHGHDGDDEAIPWSRIMLGIGVYLGHGYPKSGQRTSLAMLANTGWGPVKGRFGGHLDMTLRHPYEDHVLAFDRHEHPYSIFHLWFLQVLLTQIVTAQETHRLGAPDWLSDVVDRMARLPRSTRHLDKVVEAIWRDQNCSG